MKDIQIPKMGMSTIEVDVVKWHVAVGDRVDVGTALADVESEKATLTVESDGGGTVAEILIPEGRPAEVGAVICRIQED